MKRILFVICTLLIVALNVRAQEKPDSTLFKKYSADLKTLQDNAQKLDEAKKKFLGEYFEQLQSIQSQYQVIKMYLDEQSQKLNGIIYTGKPEKKNDGNK